MAEAALPRPLTVRPWVLVLAGLSFAAGLACLRRPELTTGVQLRIGSLCTQCGGAGSAAGWGDATLHRFRWAVAHIGFTKEYKVFPQWQCPEELQLGNRPPLDTPSSVGTKCEPWMARGAVTLLHELLLPGTAKALEWSSGSSTAWLLTGRVSFLWSIEHDTIWAPSVHANITAMFGEEYLQKHWELRHIPAQPPDTGEREDPAAFANYIAAAFLDDSHLGTFDFVSIDGRARAACFTRALQLLKPHGGVLVLDNSDRQHYAEGMALVPDHWLRADYDNGRLGKLRPQRTTVWVSCRKGSC